MRWRQSDNVGGVSSALTQACLHTDQPAVNSGVRQWTLLTGSLTGLTLGGGDRKGLIYYTMWDSFFLMGIHPPSQAATCTSSGGFLLEAGWACLFFLIKIGSVFLASEVLIVCWTGSLWIESGDFAQCRRICLSKECRVAQKNKRKDWSGHFVFPLNEHFCIIDHWG